MRKLGKAQGGIYAQFFFNFKTRYFYMKTKRQKAFSQGEPMTNSLKILGLKNFFGFFFSYFLPDLCIKNETYGCNESRTTLIRQPDLVMQ